MHLKVATSSPEMYRQVSQTSYGQPSSPFLPLFPHCGWLAWPGMAWHQAAACSAKGEHDEQNEAGANETLSVRTASHCLCVWLGKNPGGAVDRNGHLHCPHHQGSSGQKGPSPLSTPPGALSLLHLAGLLASPCQSGRVPSSHHHCAHRKRFPKRPTLHLTHQLWDSAIFGHKARIKD